MDAPWQHYVNQKKSDIKDHIIWFYMIPLIKSKETEGLVVTWAEGKGRVTGTYTKDSVSFWGDESVLKWTLVMTAPIFNIPKNHSTVHFKEWIVCEVPQQSY